MGQSRETAVAKSTCQDDMTSTPLQIGGGAVNAIMHSKSGRIDVRASNNKLQESSGALRARMQSDPIRRTIASTEVPVSVSASLTSKADKP